MLFLAMYFNGASCDIYIGQGAGKKLLDDLHTAQKSIKIISPYLSPFLVKELIELKRGNSNLSIELITSDEIEDYKDVNQSNIYKLIVQNKKLDHDAETQRNKWKKVFRILLTATVGLSVVEYLSILFLQDARLLFGIIPIIISVIVLLIYRSKISNKRIYNYHYSQLFPFKVYLSPYKSPLSDTFIHSKIYLVDDSIAYLGSLNFTHNGTTSNYETRIRTVDRNAISKMNDEFFELFHHSSLPERDIQKWGRRLYKEPIN
jgi:phosphatidylserine/phosphatidylglycerophosphate/cardiolipin synthase-like enzyme